MVRAYAPLGIAFSFENVLYVDNSDYFGFQGVSQGLYNQLVKENPHPTALDIYFLPPGVWNNGRGTHLTTSCVIGGGVETATNANGVLIGHDCGTPLISTNIVAHEVGHNLGLLHVHDVHNGQDPNCESITIMDCKCGDGVEDTSFEEYRAWECRDCDCSFDGNLSGCPPLSFPQPGNAAQNIMSYSPVACRLEFTPGQGYRMKRYLLECSDISPVITEGPIKIAAGLDITYDLPILSCYPDIEVAQGAKLRVQTPMSFDEGRGITIEGGGYVRVEGVTLDGCNNATWRGIDVEGSQLGQLPYAANKQGHLRMENGSELIGAEHPVRATGGAIVRGIGTDFTNCGTVAFAEYPYHNISYFEGCTLERDATYSLAHPNQFQLENIGLMSISACTFKTSGTNDHTGLAAFDSKFNMGGTTLVEGYETGVEVNTWFANPYNYHISNCIFRNNQTGIASWSTDNFTIKDNTFEGIGAYDVSSFQTGLAIRECTGFTITGNTFKGADAPQNIGILAADTHSEANTIKANFFEGLYAANWAIGDNKGIEAFEGLQYLCNTNNSVIGNTHDFLVQGKGIAESQGGGEATKNIFSHFNPSFGDFDNQGDGLVYFHAPPTEETPLPGYFFNIIREETSIEFGCSDGEGDGPQIPEDDGEHNLTPGEEQLLLLNFQNAQTGYNTESATYQGLLNGGLTEANLTGQVMAATAQNAAQLEQDLLGYSPYLTVPVLEAVVLRKDVFSNNSIQGILTANPDGLRPLAFQAFLYNELDATLADTILTAQYQTTARTTAEASLARHKIAMHRWANRMVQDILLDSTGIDHVQWRLWLDNKGSIEATGYGQVRSHSMEGSYATARSVRDNIPSAFGLQGNGLTAHSHFTDLSEIAITALENNGHAGNYDPATVALVQAIADNGNGLAASLAQGLLNFYYGHNYRLLPTANGQQLIAPPPIFTDNATTLYQPLTALPNPAKGQVTFGYELESDENAVLHVFDMNGKLVKSFTLTGTKGVIEWNTESLSRGIYHCQIWQPGIIPPALKLAIIK